MTKINSVIHIFDTAMVTITDICNMRLNSWFFRILKLPNVRYLQQTGEVVYQTTFRWHIYSATFILKLLESDNYRWNYCWWLGGILFETQCSWDGTWRFAKMFMLNIWLHPRYPRHLRRRGRLVISVRLIHNIGDSNWRCENRNFRGGKQKLRDGNRKGKGRRSRKTDRNGNGKKKM